MPASTTPYIITYSYGGDTNFSTATNTSTTPTVNNAASGGLTISPTSLPFGNVYLGTIPVKMVTLSNNTGSMITISSVSLTAVPGGDSYDFVGLNLCSKTLAVKKSCQVEMSFIPNTQVNTVQSAILTIVDLRVERCADGDDDGHGDQSGSGTQPLDPELRHGEEGHHQRIQNRNGN